MKKVKEFFRFMNSSKVMLILNCCFVLVCTGFVVWYRYLGVDWKNVVSFVVIGLQCLTNVVEVYEKRKQKKDRYLLDEYNK